MFTFPDAESVGNTPSETGLEKFARAVPRVLQPHIKRALQLRVEDVEAAQAIRERRIEELERELAELARTYVDASLSLRELRDALLKCGGRQ